MSDATTRPRPPQHSALAQAPHAVLASLARPERLATLEATGLIRAGADVVLNRLARTASQLLGVPVSLVSLVDGHAQHFVGADGHERWEGEPRRTPLSHSFCQYVVAGEAPLVVADAREHDVLRENLAHRELDVVAYAGVPLTTSDGETLGSFCAIDTVPREWTEEQVEGLRALADAAMSEIELRLAHQRLAAREAQLDLIYNGTSDLMFLMGVGGTAEAPEFRCESVNDALVATTGISRARIVGHSPAAVLPPALAAIALDRYATVVRTRAPLSYESHVPLPSGERTLEIRLTPIVSPDGQVRRLLGVGRDVTEWRRAEQALRDLSTRDELTGLLNRRGLRPLAEQALHVAQRTGRRDAMLYVDLDRFKPINDQWGHAAGDDALQVVAGVLRESVRAGDLVARVGGDEFVVYAAGLERAGDGQVLAARLAAALEARNDHAAAAGCPWRVELSVGVAECEPGESLDELLARADGALYAVKSRRRASRASRE